MIQVEELGVSPMEMISEEGELLVKALQGVALYPPGLVTSTKTSSPQCGHLVFKV